MPNSHHHHHPSPPLNTNYMRATGNTNKRARPDSPTNYASPPTPHSAGYFGRAAHISTPSSRASSPAPSSSAATTTTTIRVEPYMPHNNDADQHDSLLDTSLHGGSSKYIKHESTIRARSQRMCKSVTDTITTATTTITNSNIVRQTKHRYKNLSAETREKLLFTLSSFIGTVLFLLLFESINQLCLYSLELDTAVDTAFLVAYTASYLISIVWQHALHRLLLTSYAQKNVGYCASLLQTYTVYSASLAIVSLFGSLAIRYLFAPARLIALLSIPFAGVINYYSLQNDAMNSCIEEVIESASRNCINSGAGDRRTSLASNVYVFTPSGSGNTSSAATLGSDTAKLFNAPSLRSPPPVYQAQHQQPNSSADV